jgi:23S rRNA (cytosine1962-C5)-methyltransferase
MKKITLKPKKDASVRRFHPWIFSGAVERKEEGITDGDTVEVHNHKGEYLATGHYHDGSICVRIISWEPIEAGQDFWNGKIAQAHHYRRTLGLVGNPETNAYRLIHAEGDGLPGLIIDVYGRTAVVQCHSIGMHREREKIAAALRHVYGEALGAVYDKSTETLPDQYALKVQDGYLYGEKGADVIREYGHEFLIDWEGGQKTGFFLDQRENRRLVSHYAKDRTVLNAFCYTGGFSVYALAAGARLVHSVDASQKAVDLADRNAALNGFGEDRSRAFASDVLPFLRNSETKYDLIIVDPPAFAKSLSRRHNAIQGYKRLNALALEKIQPGGILFTFSCSQVVDMEMFQNTIVAAALETGRRARIMHRLGQPPDHPVSLFHPEGSYLKGLVLEVEE